MGQKQINPYSEYEKDYTLVSKNQNEQLMIRHKSTSKEYMLRKVIVKSEQELQQRIKLLNQRRKIRSEHLLNIVDFKPINDDRICGNTIYISLLIEYPFESLLYETLHRLSQPQTVNKASTPRVSPLYFQQHQLWSILYSCVLGLEALYVNDMAHESITKSLIFIDKDGVVKIGDPILLGTRTNYDRVIELFQQQKYQKEDTQRSNNFYTDSINQTQLNKQNSVKETKETKDADESFIISPELISLCKDHQYYFFDKEKSDVFVLGSLMVELGLLQNAASVNVKQKIFKTQFNELFSANGKLSERYSQTFLSIIHSMVDLDPKKRPSLSSIVQKIEEFSIQENTNSQQNSLKKNPTQPQQTLDNVDPIFKDYSLGNHLNKQPFAFGYQNKTLQNNTFKSSYFQPYSSVPLSNGAYSNINVSQQNLLSSVPSGTFPHYPSFSLPQQNKPSTIKPIEVYQQSAVKSLFSKQQPVEIKYAESPLIPVSNIKLNNTNKNHYGLNFSTPFHNLNLTESNEKKAGRRQIDKESIVQNKFTLFWQNKIEPSTLFPKANEQLPRKQNFETERFSLSNFGKIEIPTGSNQTSVNTSMLPTPRFQNPFSMQLNSKLNQLSKPLFTPTFHNIKSESYAFNPSGNQAYSNTSQTYSNGLKNIHTTQIKPANLYQANTIASNYEPKFQESLYNAKRQGFSISDDFREVSSHYVDRMEPYFSNSSVGYTLPKYRPESTSSQVIQISSQQKVKRSQSKQSNNETKNIDNLSPTKKIAKETESFLQREESPPKSNTKNPNSIHNSMINSIANLANQNYETYSNASSQNTVKKEMNTSKKTSTKKYNFYKKQLNEKLQKLQEPIQNVSIQMQKPGALMPGKSQEQKFIKTSEMKNSITQVNFEPSLHSVYVMEKQQTGSFYRGYKLNGQKHGSGVLIYADSGFYEGQFNHDFMQGYGKIYYNQNDLAYEGQFLQNCFHGHGILHNNSPEDLNGSFDFANLGNINNYWVKYDGYFKEDRKSGKCHVYFTNGQEFEGFCQNNTFEGKGKFKTLDGSFVEGIWKNNVLVEIKNDSKEQYSDESG